LILPRGLWGCPPITVYDKFKLKLYYLTYYKYKLYYNSNKGETPLKPLSLILPRGLWGCPPITVYDKFKLKLYYLTYYKYKLYYNSNSNYIII
jgi:hypothetical protein